MASRKVGGAHDYCGGGDMDIETRGLKKPLSSPARHSGPSKKSKAEETVVRPKSNVETAAPLPQPNGKLPAAAPQSEANSILAAIATLQSTMEEMKTDLKTATLTISNIAKAVEFNAAEIKGCKEKNVQLSNEVRQLRDAEAGLETRTRAVESRTVDLERYKRRWNLRLNGLKQRDREEDTWEIVAEIILKMVPHWRGKMEFILDSVHRLGPSNQERPRQIIMQFTGRRFRDELWRTTKDHPVCRELNIRFAEDLTKEDRDARLVLWPKVEAARKAGHKTVFRGPHAFINGQKVLP